jgi:ribose transport system substrate-binding protein
MRFRLRAVVLSSAAIALSLAAGGALASNNKIALVPGSPHPYFAPWAQAAADAKKDFGIAAVDFKVPSEYKLSLETELMESLLSQGYNGFGFFPVDATGVNSTVDELASMNVPAVALAGCAKDPSKVAFCLSTDVYGSVYYATKSLIKAMGGKGKIVHLAGFTTDPNTKVRMQAVQKAADETNGAVTLLQTIPDTDSQEAGDQKINALLGAQKDQIDGMIGTGYVQSVVAAKALRNLGDKRIKFIGTDDDQIVLDAIKDGFVVGTIAGNPYGQGYLGAYSADLLAGGCKVKADGPFIKTPLTDRFIDSGTILVTSDNVASYKDDLKKITLGIQKSFKDKYLTCK